jgi:hypothetical protein
VDLGARGYLGDALSGSEGRWLQGEVAAAGGGRVGRLSLRAAGAGFGLRYMDPFDFRAGGVDLRPTVSARVGRLGLSLAPQAAFGAWSTHDREGDLRVVGGDLVVEAAAGPVLLGVTGGAVDVDNGLTSGTFTRASASAGLSTGPWTFVATARGQRTPFESEGGGGLAVVGALRPGLQVHAYGGRSLRDPRFGTPGTLSVSAGVSIRPVRWEKAAAPGVATIGAPVDSGRSVRFSIRAPDAERVELAGDFTGWEPVPMERDGMRWEVERVLPPGVHHFSFLVDGEWALPADAPGVVDDGWGRENASIVIEP